MTKVPYSKQIQTFANQIEVAVRTQMAYVMSMAYNGYWFEDVNFFTHQVQHIKTVWPSYVIG